MAFQINEQNANGYDKIYDGICCFTHSFLGILLSTTTYILNKVKKKNLKYLHPMNTG
jgi:hypothetical protein